jgi:hypothetical protein
MSGARIIEFDGITAGIIVPERGGVRFFAAERRFNRLEGITYPTAADVIQGARRLAAKHDPTRPRAVLSRSFSTGTSPLAGWQVGMPSSEKVSS